MTAPLLAVRDLDVRFQTDEGLITAVDTVSFDVAAGDTLDIVGESGSGKSVTAKSIMQLNAGTTRYGEGSQISLQLGDGRRIDALAPSDRKDRLAIRGGAVSMIFQEPMASFAPAIRIGDQMTETIMLHLGVGKTEARRIAVDMLDRVGISDAVRRFSQYAFELSGGMRQRAMIAMALSTRPQLLIADEPTTALDVTIQAQVLDLIRELVAEYQMGVIFITHDLGVVAQVCDRVAVMYLGRMVETGPTRAVIRSPRHPYTRGLLHAIPKLDQLDKPLQPIPGDIPSPLERPHGCVFHTRCDVAIDGRCDADVPQMQNVGENHAAACIAIDVGARAGAPGAQPAEVEA